MNELQGASVAVIFPWLGGQTLRVSAGGVMWLRHVTCSIYLCDCETNKTIECPFFLFPAASKDCAAFLHLTGTSAPYVAKANASTLQNSYSSSLATNVVRGRFAGRLSTSVLSESFVAQMCSFTAAQQRNPHDDGALSPQLVLHPPTVTTAIFTIKLQTISVSRSSGGD